MMLFCEAESAEIGFMFRNLDNKHNEQFICDTLQTITLNHLPLHVFCICILSIQDIYCPLHWSTLFNAHLSFCHVLI